MRVGVARSNASETEGSRGIAWNMVPRFLDFARNDRFIIVI